MHKTDTFKAEEAFIETTIGPITKSHIIDKLCEENGVWKIPDSFFGDNGIKITTPHYSLSLTAPDSVRYLRFSHLKQNLHNPDSKSASFDQVPFVFENDIKVASSKAWSQIKLVHENEVIKERFADQDWTYLNHYRGSLDLRPGVSILKSDEGAAIPRERLTQNNKILFFKDVFLYEDDLGDFGYSSLRARVRVQKDCAFILMRSYIRIDNTRIRAIDNRYFIDFADYSLTREVTFSEGSYEEIVKAGFVFEHGFNNDLDQTDKVAPFLRVVSRHCERISIVTGAS